MNNGVQKLCLIYIEANKHFQSHSDRSSSQHPTNTINIRAKGTAQIQMKQVLLKVPSNRETCNLMCMFLLILKPM
jgi:hypothetical protein